MQTDKLECRLGTLTILPAVQHMELPAPRVMEVIASGFGDGKIGVAEIDPQLSDTAAFCLRYQVGLEQAANCVILEARRAERIWHAACVVLGSMRADVNGLARRTLDAKKVSFAPMEQAVALTQMEYGAITPIGLPGDWPILVDRAVVDTGVVIIGSGIRKSKLVLPGSLLALLPNAQVLDGLGRPNAAVVPVS